MELPPPIGRRNAKGRAPYQFYRFLRGHWKELSDGIQEHRASSDGWPSKRELCRRVGTGNRRWLDQAEKIMSRHGERIQVGDWTSVEDELFGYLGHYHMLEKFIALLEGEGDPRIKKGIFDSKGRPPRKRKDASPPKPAEAKKPAAEPAPPPAVTPPEPPPPAMPTTPSEPFVSRHFGTQADVD